MNMYALLLGYGGLELVEIVLVRILQLCDVCLFLTKLESGLRVLGAKRWQHVLRLLDDIL